MSIISIDPSKCVGCNSCVRVCPAKDANITHFSSDVKNLIIDIDDDLCIKCGSCIRACSHDARFFIDDTDAFLNDLQNGEHVALIVAPSIKVAFDGNWRHALNWLRSKGCTPIYDVSYGADICTWAHLRYIEKNPDSKLITQPCAAIVNYVLKHNHKLLEYLSPVQSPMMCTAIYLRKYCGFTGKIAAISPCIAKKDEFMQTNNIINYNVTLQYLKEFFDTHGIILPLSPKYSEFEFDNEPGFLGAIYPNPGGLKENLLLHKPDLKIINSEGLHKVYRDLDEYTSNISEYLPTIFDVLSCEFGCNGGSAVGQEYKTFRISSIMHDVKKYNYTQQKKNTSKKGKDLEFDFFDKKLNIDDFIRKYEVINYDKQNITQADLEKAYQSLAKYEEESRHFDCHSCGFKSCKEMAHAIAKGLNVPENCHQYTIHILDKEKVKMSDINLEVRKTSDDLKLIVEQLRENISFVNEKAQSIANYGTESSKEMTVVNNYMSDLNTLNKTILDMMETINTNIDGYKVMTNNVESIAQSINLLSLNASIEAARAGEAGKGFSVVATNIRELSDSSKQSVSSAKQNELMITNSVENVYKTVNIFSEHIKKLSEIITATKDSVQSTSDISENIQESLLTLTDLSKNISEIVARTLQILSK